jgi:hypothetical protein
MDEQVPTCARYILVAVYLPSDETRLVLEHHNHGVTTFVGLKQYMLLTLLCTVSVIWSAAITLGTNPSALTLHI